MTEEESESCVLSDVLTRWGVLYTHVPNGGSRKGSGEDEDAGKREGYKFKRMGVKRGVPDYLIFDAPRGSSAPGVAIELKRRKGGKTTDEQKQWLADLRDRGWLVKVCRGADDAIAYLRSLGYGRAKA